MAHNENDDDVKVRQLRMRCAAWIAGTLHTCGNAATGLAHGLFPACDDHRQ